MMKKMFGIACLVIAGILLSGIGIAADKKQFSTAPPQTASKVWRIGYSEGGPYGNYPKVLSVTVQSLAELGWIEAVKLPVFEDEADTGKMWAWLADNVKSKHILFVKDAYYSSNWNKELRAKNKQEIISRLNEKKDIDLMIAMGTWSGADLATSGHSVPIIVCSSSDPVSAKIVKSSEDSGLDHVHALVDPKRFSRQIESFYDLLKFKKLGVAFMDTPDGRSYAGFESIKKVSSEKKFEIEQCVTLDDVAEEKASESVVRCAEELSSKIDAFYITMQSGVNKNSLPKILGILNAKKIPTFSQLGSVEVRQGALMSISDKTNWEGQGKFHAEVIAKIFNGAKPREISQLYEIPVKIAFNKATAKQIDLNHETYKLMSDIANEVYEQIETLK